MLQSLATPIEKNGATQSAVGQGSTTPTTVPTIGIQNRRYLGNKTRLLPFIESIIRDEIGEIHAFADLFSGTGVVAHHFNGPQTPVLANDLLHANYLSLKTFLTSDFEALSQIESRLSHLQNLPPKAGYAAQHFGGAYFSHETACQIDVIRDEIADWQARGEITEAQGAILITALLYAVDKMANTCGHYDAFRRTQARGGQFRLALPRVFSDYNGNNRVFNCDANQLAQSIRAQILYLDPPYNSRQYSDTYHLLENLAQWQKPAVTGVARKMDRRHLKSRYCSRKQAPQAFKELIEVADAEYILLSYNNMAKRGNDRSNARLSDADIFEALKARGEVRVFETDFQAFSTGLANHSPNHKERLFLCRVHKKPNGGLAKRFCLSKGKRS